MDRRRFLATLASSAIALSAAPRLRGQQAQSNLLPNLLETPNRLALSNRTASPLIEPGRTGVRLSEGQRDGVAIVQGLDFSEGTIEIDLRGRAVPQRSFLGVAFHGVDATTFDAIFFSPFNFNPADARASMPSVHYHSLPRYTDERLRVERPGRYARRIAAALKPDDWFHVRIVVADAAVTVFVADETDPSLEVTLLSNRERGFIALWVGDNSNGDFANLRVAPNP